MASDITEILCELLRKRDAVGLKKYGVTLDRKDLSVEEWLDHLTEELLDGSGYAQSAKREILEMRQENIRLRARVLELEQQIKGAP